MKSIPMVVGAFLAVGMLTAADTPRAPGEADEKVIRQLLGRMEEKWNAHDVKAFLVDFAQDADVVNRFGLWFKGQSEIEKHLTELHASPFRDHLVGRSSKVEGIRFLTPDVAVAHERTQEESGRSVRTYVLQKRDGRWWVQSADITQESTPGPR
jgi:uncharacterized protein (TIGR02246 family)